MLKTGEIRTKALIYRALGMDKIRTNVDASFINNCITEGCKRLTRTLSVHLGGQNVSIFGSCKSLLFRALAVGASTFVHVFTRVNTLKYRDLRREWTVFRVDGVSIS